ncbi:MAG: hypothetical protein ABJE95_04480 [Byssovorax sp.]
MPFDIAHDDAPRIVDIEEDPYEILRYTGVDDGTASFFHAVGYLLTEYGRFQGDAPTLRRLTVTAILALFNGPARELIRKEVYRNPGCEVLPYLDALAAGELPGDRVCVWAIEHHFGVRIQLRVMTPTALLPLKNDHFCPAECDTMYVALRGDRLFLPMNHPELPALLADNYCLTCGVGVPNPRESICDDCVRRARFCVSCGLVYVATGSVCQHCTAKLTTSLREDAERLQARELESVYLPCGMERAPVRPKPLPEVDPGPRPKLKVYLSNAPFDDFRSGDGTYINAIVNWLNAVRPFDHRGLVYDVLGTRLCDAGLAARIPAEERGVQRLEIPYIKGWPTLKSETEKMTMAHWQKFYEPARQLLFEALVIERGKDSHPKSVHIFHAQVRYPDSGALFNREFLDALARRGFHVVVTCHEMKFNLLNAENMQRNVVQMNDFVACADRTIFLNEHDLMCGVKLCDAGSLQAYYRGRSATRRQLAGSVDSQRKATTMLGKLETGGASDVHPTGRCVDAIAVPPKRKASFFHIPGIATVKGVEFNVEAILARPPNVLVFGLIKQVDAMEQTAEVARAILSNPAMGPAVVYVVGKVFKDFKHNAIATLVGEMCRLSNSATKSLCSKLDVYGEKTSNDRDFYAAMEREIHTCVTTCDGAWREFVTAKCKFIEVLLARLDEVATCDIDLLRGDELHGQIAAAQGALEGHFQELVRVPYGRSDMVLEAFCQRLQALLPELSAIVEPLDKSTYEKRDLVNRANGFQLKLVALKQAITGARKELTPLLGQRKKWPGARLPIQIVFDAPPDEFQRIAALCKYAFKVDQKSMADNASSIISLMSNGCITFTESRFDTPDEFQKDNGGALSPVIMPAQKYGVCEGSFVVAEIRRREGEHGAESNRRTLKNMQTLLTKRYGLDAVAGKHLYVYKTFLP